MQYFSGSGSISERSAIAHMTVVPTSDIQPTVSHSRPKIVGANVIVPYSPRALGHKEGVAKVLDAQAAAHGRTIQPGVASALLDRTSQINISLSAQTVQNGAGTIDTVVKGFTISYLGSSVAGPIWNLEDVAVLQEFRNSSEKVGKNLVLSDIGRAWDTTVPLGNGHVVPVQGYSWQVGSDNEPAKHLYRSIFGAHFDFAIPNSVWRVAEHMLANFADEVDIRAGHGELTAHWATLGNGDLTRMAPALSRHEHANLDYLSLLIASQTVGNGYAAFACVSDDGDVATISHACATFQALSRADNRVTVSQSPNADHVADLIKVAAFNVIHGRRWQNGPMYIELENGMHGLSAEQRDERLSVLSTLTAKLQEKMGIERVEHANGKMMAYTMTKAAFAGAAIKALEIGAYKNMSRDGLGRLFDAANKYGLDTSKISHLAPN